MNPLIPIVPSSRLYLTRRGVGDDLRLARVFRDTWRRVPMRVRRRLIGHWSLREFHLRPIIDWNRAEAGLPWSSPRVEMVWGWRRGGDPLDVIPAPKRRPKGPPGKPRGHNRNAAAVAAAKGLILRFRAGIVDHMPEDVLADLIAHELAHVDQHALGIEHTFGPEQPPEWRMLDDAEMDADERMQGWWFDADSIDRWSSTAFPITKGRTA